MTQWTFDPWSALIAAILAPLAIFAARLVVRYLKDWLGLLLEAVLYTIGIAFRQSIVARVSLQRYCRLYLEGNSRYLIVPSSQEVTLEIDRIFVPLTLEHPTASSEILSHTEISTLGRRVRLVGDPGSGKSSLVKRLARDECTLALSRPSNARLPVVFELRNLKIPPDLGGDRLGAWFFNHLRAIVCQANVFKIGECFDTYARRNGLLVLLDGLDELSVAGYPHAELAINGLGDYLERLGENNSVILTMRIQFHQQVRSAFSDKFPRVLKLKPFSPSDIYGFLQRWPFPRGREDNQVIQIYEELTSRPSLRDMCRNPLILSMYVAESQAGKQLVAPDSRTEFYSKVTAELLIRRRLQQTGPAPAHSKLREQRERILGALAFRHLLDDKQPANSLNWEEGLRTVREVTGCDVQEAHFILRDLAKETGLLTEERPEETFRFIHLTFCEYFAAFEAARGREHGWHVLAEQHEGFLRSGHPHLQTRLLEVIPFASALLLPRSRQPEAIAAIAILGDQRLLARTFFETKLYEHPAWTSFLNLERERLLNAPEEEWDDEWLRDLHLFHVIVRDAALSSKHIRQELTADPAEFFGSLLKKQEKSLGRLLTAYASEDAAAAFYFSELNSIDLAMHFPDIVIRYCDQAPFFALARERAWGDHKGANLWLRLLAEAALRYPAVSEWLAASKPPEKWRREVQGIPRSKRWFAEGVVEESALTYCLSIALNSSLTESHFPFLRCVARLPPPTTKVYLKWLNIASGLCFAVTYTLGVLVAIGQLPIAGTVPPKVEKASLWAALADFAQSVGLVIAVATPVLLCVSLLSLRFFGWRRSYSLIILGRDLPAPGILENIFLSPFWPNLNTSLRDLLLDSITGVQILLRSLMLTRPLKLELLRIVSMRELKVPIGGRLPGQNESPE